MCNLCRKKFNELNEVAHIIAYSPNGPRGNIECDAEFINSYENLILLCPTCHRKVDDNPDEFSAEILINKKQEHINYVINQLCRQSVHRNSDIFCIRAFIKYGDLNNLARYIYFLPNSFDTYFLDLPDFIEKLFLDIPSALPFYDPQLNNSFKCFFYVYEELCDLLNGYEGKLNYKYRNLPPQPNFISKETPIAQENSIAYINKKYLSDEALQNLSCSLIEMKDLFLEQYRDFIRFIKQNYPEISLL